MTATQKKWTHAGAIALVGVLTDAGAQLASGAMHPSRAILVGVVLGGVARVAGAILASLPTETTP